MFLILKGVNLFNNLQTTNKSFLKSKKRGLAERPKVHS